MNRPEVTVLLLVNNDDFFYETIDSILKQSFSNWELVILNEQPTQKTEEILHSYSDSRILIRETDSDIIKNMNAAIYSSQGDYIARINANDVMHVDRLRLQLKRYKMYPEITVCTTWIKPFKTDGTTFPPFAFGEEFVEQILLKMLSSAVFDTTSAMINKSFLLQNNIKYKNFPFVEDYKLMVDIAIHEGRFFIEPQLLSYKRVCEMKNEMKDMVEKQSIRIKKDVIKYLADYHTNSNVSDLYRNMIKLEKEKAVTPIDIFHLFSKIFQNTRYTHVHEPQK